MGWMNEQGLGVERDLAEAARWDSKAADEGDARGREDLARVILAAKAAKEGEKLLVAHAPMWTISGVVLADDTGKPISNALVRVASPGINMRGVRDHREGVLDGRTDAEGPLQRPGAAE
jgi:TPR repeat protein